jgi:hypothetical protein
MLLYSTVPLIDIPRHGLPAIQYHSKVSRGTDCLFLIYRTVQNHSKTSRGADCLLYSTTPLKNFPRRGLLYSTTQKHPEARTACYAVPLKNIPRRGLSVTVYHSKSSRGADCCYTVPLKNSRGADCLLLYHSKTSRVFCIVILNIYS